MPMRRDFRKPQSSLPCRTASPAGRAPTAPPWSIALTEQERQRLWASEPQQRSIEERVRHLARLRSALREERRRGIAGHWSYDLARHAELARIYRAEERELSALCRHRENRIVVGARRAGRKLLQAQGNETPREERA